MDETTTLLRPLLFLIECYDSSGTREDPGPLPALSQGTARLVAAVHLPSDQVILALVEAPNAEIVAAVAEEAGWQIDRLIPATWLQSSDS